MTEQDSFAALWGLTSDPATGASPQAVEPQALSRRELREREGRRSAPVSNRKRPVSRGRQQRRRPASGRTRTRQRATSTHSIGSRLLAFGALLFAGALVVAVSVPANAFYPVSSAVALSNGAPVVAAPAQTLAVDTAVATASTARDTWGVTSWAEMLKARYGTRDYSYAVGSGSIRWPFPYAVPISDGWGERVSPCRGCSTFHQGVDFVPGYGAPIYVIADGVVIQHEDGNGEYGNFVIIEHTINGQSVTSTYAHMQHGSVALNVGQVVKVGDFIGLVGQTGAATGPHLHFEIAINGVKVDPFAWLKANTN